MIIGKINDDVYIDDAVLWKIKPNVIKINNQEITDLETFNKVVDSIKEKDKEIDRLNNTIEELKRFNRIRENYLQLIADIGYDYDGMNTVEGLKGLVDELCKYALWGRDLYDYKPIYENNGKVYNILDEELKELKGESNEI